MKSIGLSPALVWVLAQSFDGGDSVSFRLRRQHGPSVNGVAIQQNRICASEPLLIAKLHAVKTQSAQRGKQGRGRGRVDDLFNSVDLECDVHVLLLVEQVYRLVLQQIGVDVSIRPVLPFLNQPSFDWVIDNVIKDSCKFSFISYNMIVTFMLPERAFAPQ